MEKHITLLEELEIKNKRMDYLNLKEYGLFEIEAVKAFISSREEKAREEGRKEYFVENYNTIMNLENVKNDIITQYKEELLGKIENIKVPPYPVESEKLNMLQEGAVIGFQDCLSEVKKLLKEE